MKIIRKTLSIALILSLALPLLIMPISAADKEPTIEEFVELTRESQLYLNMLYKYPLLGYKDPNEKEKVEISYIRELAIQFGYYDPGFEIDEVRLERIFSPATGEEEYASTKYDCFYTFPDTVTKEKINRDIEKYFVWDFIGVMRPFVQRPLVGYLQIVEDHNGKLYNKNRMPGSPIVDPILQTPNLDTARIISKSDKQITLEFDDLYEPGWNIITIQYTKTSRGWRISGATGEYYRGFKDFFAPEVPETADNSVVYIALASVSVIALAGVTLVSAKRKKDYIA